MTKNESKLLSLQGIAKASAFCLLLSAFSVNAAMAAPAPAGTVDEVMAVQQGKKVTGVVVDGTGEPVIGANVVVKGTTNGTITDFDGNYTIEGVSANDVLVISYIGYLSQEVPVGNQSMIKVTLKEDTQTLDEVVVVGYGTMKKSDVTGSISTAKGDDLVKNQSFSALDNLRGKVSGVNIFSNSSQPGAYSNRVVIRGIATINSSSNPLYVVDGVVMENFDLVNPNDIESMEVLKDASAAAIYGARGANGVIMVTTKRGKKDGEGVAISYQGSVSVSSIARKMDLLNAQEWTDTFMKGLENENKWLGTNWSLNRTDWFTDRNYFDANGKMVTDTWIGKRYLKSNGQMAKSCWVGAYYINKKGNRTKKTRSTGIWTQKGKTYFLNSNYQKAKSQWVVSASGRYYYTDENGIVLTNQWVGNYYVGETGARVTNQKLQIDDKTYYFTSDGSKATGIVTLNGKTYLFDRNGVMVTGWYNNSVATFYFLPTTGEMVKSQIMIIDNVFYSFDANGYMTDQNASDSDLTFGSKIAAYATQFIGNPYVWGGTSLTNGTDCSGFTQSVLANFGISISRTAASQSGGGTAVDMSNLQPGDLLFYDNGSGIGHVSMYIGNGQVVHASNEQTGIIVSSVDYRTACAARSYF